MKAVTIFFYLLCILLPTQLARHFFFDFSSISGLRSDYLVPTVYVTDILIMLMGGAWFWHKLKSQNSKIKTANQKLKTTTLKYLLFVFCYLLFNSIFIASDKWIALYKLLKLAEFLLLGYLIVIIKPKLFNIIFCLSIGVFYSSLIALSQFILQKSVGGLLWFLGERTFYASTPGIAASAWNGMLYLRPYAAFPHPNVLAGFLALVLPLIFYLLINAPIKIGNTLRVWFLLSWIVGLICLILTFSRGVWVVAFLGHGFIYFEKKAKLLAKINKNKQRFFIFIYILITISIGLPLLIALRFPVENRSIWERADLVAIYWKMLASYPIFGVGLNNSFIQIKEVIPSINSLYQLQPAHNIYLLILSETGIAGFTLFIIGFTMLVSFCLEKKSIFVLQLFTLFLLGLFDHYLFTLQQGQLLLTIFSSLALSKINE